jgi:hypothetical protein
LQIHTDIAADRLTDHTRNFALGIFADLTVFTSIGAFTTVETVSFDIDATATTID